MALQDRLDRMRTAFEKKAPADALAIMHRSTNDLREGGIMDRTAKDGQRAPDFELSDSHGQTTSLAGLLSTGPAIFTFFRGHW